MRGLPDGDANPGIADVGDLLERCADLERHADTGALPPTAAMIRDMATGDLVVHLHVSLVVERIHRSGLVSGSDECDQNLADGIASPDELTRRRRSRRRHPSFASPSR